MMVIALTDTGSERSGGSDPSSPLSPLGVDCFESPPSRSRAFPMEIRRSGLKLFQQVACEGSEVNYKVVPNGRK